MKKIKQLVFSILAVAIVSTASAATGKLKGKVIDKSTNEPLIGATVMVKGTTKGVTTDVDGSFELELDRKPHTLSISYVSYTTQEMDVETKAQNPELTVLLESDSQMMDAVRITAKIDRSNEFGAIADQRHSIVATQIVGVKELSRKGVGDAQGAVMKVSGISKQEGVKNVFVRGLGDRYNSTTLNGLPIPSEDPEYKNISLDFFSTDVIQSVNVNKAFYATGASDVGGANIDISSKNLSGDRELSVSVSGGVNTQTLGADMLKADGVNAFGFSNNRLPSNAENSYDFENKLSPTSARGNFDRGFGISGGKRFEIAGNPLTFFAVASYDRGASYMEETSREGSTTNALFAEKRGYVSEISTNYLALANVNYSIGSKHTIDYNFMYVHSNNQSVGLYDEFNNSYADWGGFSSLQGVVLRQQANDNSMYINQLISKWTLAERLKFNVAGSYNSIVGLEPDRRINTYGKSDDGTYTQISGETGNQRFYSELNESDINVKASVSYALSSDEDTKSAVSVGYMSRFVEDDFVATQYNQTVRSNTSVDNIFDLELDDMFNAESLAAGNFYMSTTESSYEVTKSIHSAFVDVTYDFSDAFTANVGFKYDLVDIAVSADLNGSPAYGGVEDTYMLPSLNLRYAINDKHTMRLSASKTYTLPQSKELSPYQYVGASFNSEGNENLLPSDNYNFDLKWDWYISGGELLSVTGFYKYIQNPISRISIYSAGNFLSYKNISDGAVAAGVEIEFRKNLYTQNLGAGKSNKLSMGINGSYIYTDVEIYEELAPVEQSSQLEGAAPIIANADLSFSMIRGEKTFTNTLVYNYLSDKIYGVGTNGFKNTVERSVSTLDFVSSAKLSDNISISLKANNLLNPLYELTRESAAGGDEMVLNSYAKGIDISLGFSCNF